MVIKNLLDKGFTLLIINGKLAVITALRKLRKPPFRLSISLVVYVNKIPLFSKDLITFIISFISLLE